VTYVIAEPCVDVMDKSCVEVCPVDCIHETGRMLVIDPDECIDCGACEPECPVEAIFPEDAVPPAWDDFVRITHAYGTGIETVANLVAERVAAHPPPVVHERRPTPALDAADLFVEVACLSDAELLEILDRDVRPDGAIAQLEVAVYLDLHYKRLLPPP
jgi:NAD-dependent dihydropyrimidine dehydrogenase PreA subunit